MGIDKPKRHEQQIAQEQAMAERGAPSSAVHDGSVKLSEKACSACRAGKRKCVIPTADASIPVASTSRDAPPVPCVRCSQRDIDCTFDTPKKRGRPLGRKTTGAGSKAQVPKECANDAPLSL